MLKKRLIFTLLIENSVFMLSRNFFLQSVGDIDWIKEYYDFDSISASIDELVVLNVGEHQSDLDSFSKQLIQLTKNCFIPVAAGGGIRKIKDAALILDSGADKLVLNTPIIEDPDLIRSLVERYGSQCIVASIDYKNLDNKREVYISNGAKATGLSVKEVIGLAQELKVGEIYLTCIDKDGTGMGYDLDFLKGIVNFSKVPIILSGGAGHGNHLSEGFTDCLADAVSTANLFNFMTGGLQRARNHMIKDGINLAQWNLDKPKIETK